MSKVGPFVSFAYFDNISFKKDNREYLMPLFRNVFNGLINTYLLLSLRSEKTDFHQYMYMYYIYNVFTVIFKIVMTKSFVQITTMDIESWS